jgi:hypothetical protein
MTNNLSSMFIFFRILNSLIVFLLFIYVYKKYIKNYLTNLAQVDHDNKQKQADNIKLLQAEYLASEQDLKKQAEEIYQIHANMQLWQKKIDAKHKIDKQQQADLILKIQDQVLRKAQNQALSQNILKLADELSNDLSLTNQIKDLFEDEKIQKKYLKKSLELINEH